MWQISTPICLIAHCYIEKRKTSTPTEMKLGKAKRKQNLDLLSELQQAMLPGCSLTPNWWCASSTCQHFHCRTGTGAGPHLQNFRWAKLCTFTSPYHSIFSWRNFTTSKFLTAFIWIKILKLSSVQLLLWASIYLLTSSFSICITVQSFSKDNLTKGSSVALLQAWR